MREEFELIVYECTSHSSNMEKPWNIVCPEGYLFLVDLTLE